MPDDDLLADIKPVRQFMREGIVASPRHARGLGPRGAVFPGIDGCPINRWSDMAVPEHVGGFAVVLALAERIVNGVARGAACRAADLGDLGMRDCHISVATL